MNSFLLAPLLAVSLQAPEAPVELGRVHFLRSIDEGLAKAKAQNMPAFVLFQEIPGCSTCQGFGRGPLSQPLFVEAIETLFVPVAIHNNAGGSDARALERFGEPAWNNPVVRFFDGHGKDLIERREGIWSQAALAQRMSAALVAAKCELPSWWKLAELDARVADLPRAVFAMNCFWNGQARLGALDAVADARPAHLEGFEVVEVRYDPARLSIAQLIAAAKDANVADRVWVAGEDAFAIAREALGERAKRLTQAPTAASDSDDLRVLKSSPWAKLDVPRAQALRLNARFASSEGLPEELLSPRQRERVEVETKR